jgi:hypothetical protein
MGLTESPRIFTRVSRFAGDLLRKRGVLLVMYMDDLLVVGSTQEECQTNVNITVNTLQFLGFLLNVGKCSLAPSTSFIYLGQVWNTFAWTVALKPVREQNI